MQGVRSDAPYLSDADKAAMTAGRYRMEYHLMREMGWSWRDLCDAPFDLISEIEWRIASEREWTRKKQEQPTK